LTAFFEDRIGYAYIREDCYLDAIIRSLVVVFTISQDIAEVL
jgi:hypothetical protein